MQQLEMDRSFDGRSACGQPIVSRRPADTIGEAFNKQPRREPDDDACGFRLCGAERPCGVADEAVVRLRPRAGGGQV